LERIKEAFDKDANLENLLLAPYFQQAIAKAQPYWRQVVVAATQLGLPAIEFSNALAYYDSIRRERLPANLLQAQRDYFGAHTYKRTDKEGTFHTDWIHVRKQPRN
jgi:6-phosphogluconate dehydrogenase